MWDVYQQHSRRFSQGLSTERTRVFSVSRNVSLTFRNRYERQNQLFDRRDVQKLQLADDDAEAKMERRVEPQPDKLDVMYDLIAELDDEESSIMLYVVDAVDCFLHKPIDCRTTQTCKLEQMKTKRSHLAQWLRFVFVNGVRIICWGYPY